MKRFFSGTLLSRLSGLGRDLAMAFAFGDHPSVAAFMVAFRFSNLLRRLLGEGPVLSRRSSLIFRECAFKMRNEQPSFRQLAFSHAILLSLAYSFFRRGDLDFFITFVSLKRDRDA